MTETLVARPPASPAATPPAAPPAGEPRATRREWLGLAVLALPTLLAAMDFSVLFLALPRLSAGLRPSGSQLLWITDIYGFMVAGFLVTMGALGNRIGRRRLLTAGAAAFGLASVAAAYSSSPGLLIAARALLGIAGATLMPSTLGLISTMFRHPGQRTSAVSLWAACLLAGTAIGPVLGGVLLQFFWWGSVFLIGLPVMAVLVIAAPLLLPEHRDPAQGRLDLVSVALSLAAVLPAIYGLKTLTRSGPTGPAVLALVAGLACGALFVRRQRSAASPLLDLRLFRYPAFTAAVGILLAAGAVSGGIGFLFAQYLQLVAGLSPLRAGLWSLPDPAAMIACSLLCPLVVRRIRPGYVIGGGLAVSAAGFWLLTQVHAGPGPAVAVAGVVIVFAGVTPAWVLGTDLIIGSVPPASRRVGVLGIGDRQRARLRPRRRRPRQHRRRREPRPGRPRRPRPAGVRLRARHRRRRQRRGRARPGPARRHPAPSRPLHPVTLTRSHRRY